MNGWVLWIYDAHPLPAILLAFAGADIASGVLIAIGRGELSSSVSHIGLTRKICMLIIVAMCYLMQRIIPDVPLGAIACCLYISKEGLSLVENAILLGVPVPESFIAALEKVHSQRTSPKRAREEIRLQSAEIKADSLVVRSRDTDITDTITEEDDRESIL